MSMTIESYMPSESPNAMRVTLLGRVTLWFSYNTLVAFSSPWTGLLVCENIWSRTTGKHLNMICSNKSLRMDHRSFEQEVAELERKLELCFKHIDSIDLMKRLEDASKEE